MWQTQRLPPERSPTAQLAEPWPILLHIPLQRHTTLQINPLLMPIKQHPLRSHPQRPTPPLHCCSTQLGVYKASPPTMRSYQPTHGQNGRRQSLLKGIGPSPSPLTLDATGDSPTTSEGDADSNKRQRASEDDANR